VTSQRSKTTSSRSSSSSSSTFTSTAGHGVHTSWYTLLVLLVLCPAPRHGTWTLRRPHVLTRMHRATGCTATDVVVKARGRRAGHVRRVSSQGRAHSPSSALEGRGKLRGVRRGEVGSALWRGPWGVAVPVAAAAHAATSHRCLRRRPPRRRGCVSVSVWVGVTRREFGRVPFRAAYVKARYCYDLTYVPSRGLFYARSLPHAQRAHASPGLSCAMSLCARSLFGLSRSAVSRSSRASSYRPSCIVDIARFT